MDVSKERSESDPPREADAPRRAAAAGVRRRDRHASSSASAPGADGFLSQAETEFGRLWRPGALGKLLRGAADSVDRTASMLEDMVAAREATLAELTRLGQRIDQRQNDMNVMLKDLARAGTRR